MLGGDAWGTAVITKSCGWERSRRGPGTSIRDAALHYDRIGLLRPAHPLPEAGYRLYAADDLLRLQQVLTLRYLGFPLAKIGELLDRPDVDLVTAMRISAGFCTTGSASWSGSTPPCAN